MSNSSTLAAVNSAAKTLSDSLGYDLCLSGYGVSGGDFVIDVNSPYLRVDIIWNEGERTLLSDSGVKLNRPIIQITVMYPKSAAGMVDFALMAALNAAKAQFANGTILGDLRVYDSSVGPRMDNSTDGEATHIGYPLTINTTAFQ